MLLFGCEKKFLSPKEYLGWVENPSHGLTNSKQIGEIEYSLAFLPVNYLVLKDIGTTEVLSPALFKEKKKKKEGLQYYLLKINLLGNKGDLLHYKINNENEYYSRAEYYSFSVQSDLQLVDGHDTLPCVLFHFENNYSLTPYIQLLMGFSNTGKNRNDNDIRVIFDDKVFNNGKIILNINKEKTTNIPDLII